MRDRYLLGIDFGSGASKATLLSTAGQVVATATKEYPTYYPQIGWAEQEPEDWYTALRDNFREIVAKTGIAPDAVAAVALDAATHTGVLLDEEFRVLRRAIFWTDQRSRTQAAELKRQYGARIFELAYHQPDPIWTLPQLLWIKENEPEVWTKTARLLFVKDYVRYRLTGQYVTDRIEALGSMLLDAQKTEWSLELCAMAGFPAAALPKLVAPTDVVGYISSKAARETGLSESTMVVAGTTDTAMEILGAGAIRPGQATVKLATAGRICAITDRAYPHPQLVNYPHVLPGLWYPGTATKACAASYRWYRDVLGEYETDVAAKTGSNAYELMDRAAMEIAPGAEGLFYHPYLLGELTPYADPCLRGSFTGITAHHTKAHFNRAVLEGVAYSLRDCIGVLSNLEVRMEEFRIIGGGARSDVWRQIVSDVLGIAVLKVETDDSSFGAAMLAGVGAGLFAGFDEAVARCVRTASLTEPNERNHCQYERLFPIYQEIHDGLAPVYYKLAAMDNSQ
jgi:xylulokinase